MKLSIVKKKEKKRRKPSSTVDMKKPSQYISAASLKYTFSEKDKI